MMWVRCWPLSVVLSIGLAVPLAGCGSGRSREEREAQINIYPDHYRADVLAALHTYVSDPIGIRDAYVSDPTVSPIGRQNRYAACVRFNARNRDGRYVGSRGVLAVAAAAGFYRRIVAAQSGAANESNQSAFVKERCGAAGYKRFPEL